MGSRRRAGPGRAVAPALALAAALALAGRAARADAEQDAIHALIAQNRAPDAIWLALRRARRLGTDAPAWDQVLTLAGWTSNQPAALEALRHLVVLRPEDRAVRLSLAQRLLWTHATREALPHARWLLARPTEHDPVALEVAAWVLLAEHQPDEARAATVRWIAAAPHDPRPRWVLADQTHWTSRWRDARDQYARIGGGPPNDYLARSRTRAEALRHDHPDSALLAGQWWHDTVGVSYAALAAEANAQLPWPVVLYARGELGRWSQDQGAVTGSVGVVTAQARARLELWDAVWPELTGGFETNTAGRTTPVGSAALRLSLAGRVFGTVGFGYDRHRVSLQSELDDLRVWGPAWTLYAEPTRVWFASTDGAVQWVSDGNLRTRVLVATGVHNRGMWQLEPRVWGQYDAYRDMRPNASPYFTPTVPWSVGGDLTGRFKLDYRIQIEATLGLVVQGTTVALRPSARAYVELARHLRLAFTAGYVGSPQYSQLRFDGSLGYLF